MELIKHRVVDYWTRRAEGFEAQRLREFESEKRGRWLAELRQYLPEGKPLRFVAERLWDAEGNEIDDTRRAMMPFRMHLPCFAPPLSILRKYRETP